MAKEYNRYETKILKLLGKTDFRGISKKDLMTITHLNWDKLSPEVQQSLINQFPNIKSMMESLSSDYSKTEEDVIKSTQASSDRVFDMMQNQMEAYDKELERNDLTKEERDEIIQKKENLLDKAIYQNSQNQSFYGKMLKYKKAVVAGLALAGLSALGIVVKRSPRN